MKKISRTCIYFLKQHAFYKKKTKKKHDIHFGNYSEDNNNLKIKIYCKNLLPLSKKMFLKMTYTVKNTQGKTGQQQVEGYLTYHYKHFDLFSKEDCKNFNVIFNL